MLGENIKEVRISRGLSINALAKACGMSPGYLSDLEKGKKDNPSMDMLEKIANELNVTVQQLFKEDIDKIDEIDELENEMKLLYSKIKNLSSSDRQKVLKMIEIFEGENGN
ncbi:helix-turn-helix transcriptional regulator [uncultured Clostridium sp.]|uniref:helix-turn-helix domain-containing protein n=1 Tax=uncultured Clostridium sp. TaxID=59620 RepID=UPI0028EF294F|nr:helix-turn-helix transcriptional regulator [uncultured Clostridium sp.]